MVDCGRIQAILLATVGGNVVYERFYDSFTDLEKADIRAAFQAASDPVLGSAVDETEYVSRYRTAAITLMKVADLVFYIMGTGEYDELALAEILQTVVAVLKDVLQRTPSEAAVFRDYGKVALAIDEMIYEGILEATDKDAIRRGMRLD